LEWAKCSGEASVWLFVCVFYVALPVTSPRNVLRVIPSENVLLLMNAYKRVR